MASPRPQSFAALLRQHRLAAGLTQEALATKAGLSAEAIGVLERGQRRTPHRDTVALLADALGLAAPERAQLEAAARGARVAPSAPSPAPDLAALASAPPLVGRARELIRLDRHLAGDGPPLLLLTGEPGIGKSRLLQEAAARAREAGWSVLAGGCTRRSGQEPYAPLLGALARFVAGCPPAQLRADLEGCAWLVRLLPELAERAVVPAPSWTLPPEQERRLMFGAVERLLANVAGPAGTLLLLDDLQWAGPDALDLLAALARVASERPLRLVVAYRPTEVPAEHPLATQVADLAREGLADELALGPLAPAAARELLTGLLAGAGVDTAEPERTAERLLARAGGVPFFLVSCAREVATQSDDERGDAGLPWTVRQSVRQRAAALPETARALLGLAAVAGRELLRPALLAAAVEALAADRAALLGAIEAACAAGLLVEDERGDYRFAHDLVREALLADLGAARRAAWHRAWAEALERLPEGGRPERAAELAWHFAEGDEPARALPHALAAGDRAEAAYAHAEAERHYATAAELARAAGDAGREAEALQKLGGVLYRVRRLAGAVAAFERAADLCRGFGDLDGVARAVAACARAYAWLGRPAEALARLEALLTTLGGAAAPRGPENPRGGPGESADPGALAAAATAHLSPGVAAQVELAFQFVLIWPGCLDDSLRAAERAMAHARAADDARLQAKALEGRAQALSLLGRFDVAVPALEEAIRRAGRLGDLVTLFDAVTALGATCAVIGDLDRAATCAARALRLVEELGDPAGVAMALGSGAEVAYFTGDWERSRACAEGAVAVWRRSDVPRQQVSFVLGALALATGRDRAAALDAVRALARVGEGDDPEGPAWVLRALAERALLGGRARKAQARLDPLCARLPKGYPIAAWLLPLLAWGHLELGEPERAEALASQALDQATAQGARLYHVDALRIWALVAARRGRIQEAGAALEESLALCRAMPYPYAEAKALYVSGRLHAARGEPERARERYEQALAILGRLGERLYAEHVERALAELVASLPARPESG